MSLVRRDDYLRENRRTRPHPTTDKNLPKTLAKDLEHCPRHCSQRRTRRNRLSERKTFDPRTNKCRNCGFEKDLSGVSHAPLFLKASTLEHEVSGNHL